MTRVFEGVKGMSTILPRQHAGLNMIEGVKRQQTIISTVGVLFTEIVACACMICVNPVLGFLFQDKSSECKQRNAVGSHRFFAFGFPVYFALHMALWVTIYSHVLKKRRDEKLQDAKEERPQVLQVSSLISSQR